MLPPSPFNHAEALDTGITPSAWRELVRDGRVRDVYRGWYADAELPDTVQLRFAIAKRVLPANSIVCRRSAAWLDGLDVLDHRGLPTTPRLEVLTVDQERRSRSRLISAHVADDLLASDVVHRDGLAVTTPLRTAADLARFAPRPDALVAVDAYLHHGLIDLGAFTRQLVRWKRRRGIRQAWEMAAIADGGSESGGESRMRLRVHDMGLPRPELQVPVHDHVGVVRYRLDLGWTRWRLALEYDGEQYHGEDAAAHDEARRRWIGRRGWTVEAFRKEDIFTAERGFERRVGALVTQARAA
jgi:hypothetical protein